MGIGRPFQCLLANFVKLRQVLILALDISSGPLTNFKGACHKIPCSTKLLVSEKVGQRNVGAGGNVVAREK